MDHTPFSQRIRLVKTDIQNCLRTGQKIVRTMYFRLFPLQIEYCGQERSQSQYKPKYLDAGYQLRNLDVVTLAVDLIWPLSSLFRRDSFLYKSIFRYMKASLSMIWTKRLGPRFMQKLNDTLSVNLLRYDTKNAKKFLYVHQMIRKIKIYRTGPSLCATDSPTKIKGLNSTQPFSRNIFSMPSFQDFWTLGQHFTSVHIHISVHLFYVLAQFYSWSASGTI